MAKIQAKIPGLKRKAEWKSQKSLTNRSLSLNGIFIWLHGGGSGKKETLTLQLHRSLFLAMRCLRKNYLSWLPCVHHLKYCKLLCVDLNRNHICFSYMRHWWIKKDLRKLYITLVAGSLAVFFLGGGIAEKVELKKIILSTVCALCMVCVDWCRFSEMKCLFRRDHTARARVKKLAILVCSRCIVNFTVILIANISKYRWYIYLYIVFHKA